MNISRLNVAPATESAILLKRGRVRERDELVDILIVAGRIDSISKSEDADDGKLRDGVCVYDLDGRLVIPGLVNGHAHLDKAFLPHTATSALRYEDGYLVGPGLRETKAEFTVASVKARARRAIDAAIAAGTIAIRTHVDIDPYAGLKGLEAILDLKKEYRSLIEIQTVAFPQDGFIREPQTRELMEEACRLGVDVIGGKPSADPDFHEHIDIAYELATKHDRDIDMHIDTSLEPDYNASIFEFDGLQLPSELETAYLAQKALETGFQGRVTASHLCGLGALLPRLADDVITLLRRAGVSVIVNPISNLYWGARGDTYNVRRGIAPVKKLLDREIVTAYGTDNFQDAWNLYSGPDMLVHGLVTAASCHMTTAHDLWTVVDMATTRPAGILKLRDYGFEPGRWADLVVLETDSLIDAMTQIVPRTYVFHHGNVTAVTRECRQVLFR